MKNESLTPRSNEGVVTYGDKNLESGRKLSRSTIGAAGILAFVALMVALLLGVAIWKIIPSVPTITVADRAFAEKTHTVLVGDWLTTIAKNESVHPSILSFYNEEILAKEYEKTAAKVPMSKRMDPNRDSTFANETLRAVQDNSLRPGMKLPVPTNLGANKQLQDVVKAMPTARIAVVFTNRDDKVAILECATAVQRCDGKELVGLWRADSEGTHRYQFGKPYSSADRDVVIRAIREAWLNGAQAVIFVGSLTDDWKAPEFFDISTTVLNVKTDGNWAAEDQLETLANATGGKYYRIKR